VVQDIGVLTCYGLCTLNIGGRDSAVGTATRCRLNGPCCESRWGRHFPYLFRPAPRHTQPPVRWIVTLCQW